MRTVLVVVMAFIAGMSVVAVLLSGPDKSHHESHLICSPDGSGYDAVTHGDEDRLTRAPALDRLCSPVNSERLMRFGITQPGDYQLVIRPDGSTVIWRVR